MSHRAYEKNLSILMAVRLNFLFNRLEMKIGIYKTIVVPESVKIAHLTVFIFNINGYEFGCYDSYTI